VVWTRIESIIWSLFTVNITGPGRQVRLTCVSVGSPRKAANDIEGQRYHGEDVGLIEGKLAENADPSASSLDIGRQ